MLRFVLSALALVGVLATEHPSFADPPTAAAPDHPQAAAVLERIVPAPAWSSSPDGGCRRAGSAAMTSPRPALAGGSVFGVAVPKGA
jgi:hypothetical protein